MKMEATVDPQCGGPDWMPITPKAGSLFHAETHRVSGRAERLGIVVQDGEDETKDFNRAVVGEVMAEIR